MQEVIEHSMNVIEYKSFSHPICYCVVDNTYQYGSAWTKELIKNQADFTISNIVSKKYDVFQGTNEDQLLNHVAALGYSHAVVLSSGTEFVNGSTFFTAVRELVKEDFFIAGHILDRGEAYYELHHQCFIVNLTTYRQLGAPCVGKQDLGDRHSQLEPVRSKENIHDDYTPISVESSSNEREYNHKLHGWNILSAAFNNKLPVLVFNEKIRNGKKHFYPENQLEFLNQIQWAYQRYNYCSTTFVHTAHTDEISIDNDNIEQIITPASGAWFADYVKGRQVHVIFYDYNQASLDYWKTNAPVEEGTTYEFIKLDLLSDDISPLIKNKDKKTLFNISNIFCYEGTAMFYSLEYRLKREMDLYKQLPNDWKVMASIHSWTGFAESPSSIADLKRPTWHTNGDWVA